MCSKKPCVRRKRRGFSLVELMVVIVIIGLLAGTVTVGIRSYLIRSKQNVARMEIAKICQAVESFYIEYDRYPSNDEGLQILTQTSDRFPEPLLERLPADPWKNAYEYFETGSNPPYKVISYGADGREGGSAAEADISSADLQER